MGWWRAVMGHVRDDGTVREKLYSWVSARTIQPVPVSLAGWLPNDLLHNIGVFANLPAPRPGL